MLENYDFIDDKVMAYFKKRLVQAPFDADYALELHQGPRQDARRAGSLRRRRALQVQRALGAARCAAPCLRRAARGSRPAPSARRR